MDDLAVPQHHRSGAHRARRHPLLVALVTIGAVAVASAVLLWALLASGVLGVGDELLEAGSEPSGAAVVPSGEASGTPSADASPLPSAVPSVLPSVQPTPEPSVAPSVEPSAEPSVEPSPEATADRSLPLVVLNSTSTQGLAAAAAEALGDEGWEVVEVGNYDGDEIPTTVLYPEEPDEDDPEAAAVAAATASAVAADLGVGEATASADVDRLTVVLGSDYEP